MEKKTTTYGFGNPGLGLGQAHKLSRVKPSLLDNWMSNDNTDINK